MILGEALAWLLHGAGMRGIQEADLTDCDTASRTANRFWEMVIWTSVADPITTVICLETDAHRSWLWKSLGYGTHVYTLSF